MLNIKKLSFSIGGSLLFDETSVNIPTGQKVGIVGRNGTGKTSLFKLIRNEWTVDSGIIEIPRHFRIGGVEQEAPATNISLIETVMQQDKERTSLLAEASASKLVRSLSCCITVSIKLMLVAGASCSTPPILKCLGISIIPLSTVHSFLISLNKLVLPVPFRPTIPTF